MLLPVLTKELKAYAASPLIYVAGAVFVGLAGYFFYTNLIMRLLLQGSGISIDMWEMTINDIRLLVMLLIPVISMRMLAEERRLGTIELLFTSPLSEWDIVLGKYLSGIGVIGLLVCTTLLFPALFSLVYPLDYGQLISAYAGIMLLCCALAAAGIFFSSITESQLISAVVTAGLGFFLWFIDQADSVVKALGPLTISSMSLQKHFFNFNRGVVSVRDIIFFAGFIVFFIVLTIEILKLRTRELISLRLPFGVTITLSWLPFATRAVACCLMFAWCCLQPGIPALRFDLTEGRIHSPSAMTKKAFARLQHPFVLSVGCERVQRYQYEDFFEQLNSISPFFIYNVVDLDRNPVAAANIEITKGGAGRAEYNGRIKHIETVNEESIVAAIFDLTRDTSKKIQIITSVNNTAGNGGLSFFSTDTMLGAQGYLLEITDAFSGRSPDPDTKLLIVRDVQADIPENTLETVAAYFERGGSVLMLLDGPSLPNVTRFLNRYNVELGDNYIIDREHGGSGFDELTPVVFFNKEHPAVAECAALAAIQKTRSVQVGTQPRAGFSVTVICFSGRGSWAENDLSSALSGRARFDSGVDIYGPVAIGVSIEKTAGKAKNSGGRMIVIGSGSFMADGQTEILGNATFAKKLIGWVTSQNAQPGPAFGKTMTAESAPLRITDTHDRIFFWSLVVLAPSLFLLAGAAVFCVRRLRH